MQSQQQPAAAAQQQPNTFTFGNQP
jgi:hypothetical protein